MSSMIDGPSKVVDNPFKEHMTIFQTRVGFEKKPNKHRNCNSVTFSFFCFLVNISTIPTKNINSYNDMQ